MFRHFRSASAERTAFEQVSIAALLAAICGFAGSGSGCGKDPIEETCEGATSALICGAEVDEDGFAEMVDSCVKQHEEAEDISDSCAATHMALLKCLDKNSDCNQIEAWRLDKCGEDDETPCASESAAFCDACPGLWSAP